MDNEQVERRQNNNCPKCNSKLKAIIGNDLVCLSIGCSYIFRRNVFNKVRGNDQTIAQLKDDWQ